MDEIRRLAEPLARQARRAPVGDRVRRRRRRDQLHARAADARTRASTSSGGSSHGADEFFAVDEDDPQRAPGRPARADADAAGDLPPLQRAERGGVRGRLRLRDRPRPAAGGDDRALPGQRARTGSGAATSTSRRRTATCSTSCCRRSRATTRRSSTCREYVPRDAGLPPAVHLAAGDRPADAEEHGALARGRGVHRRPVRDRRRAAAADAGLALRPLEGPARRDRRLPDRQGRASRTCSSRSSARWRTTTRRAGTTTTAPSRYADGDPDIYILSQPEQHRLGRGQRLPGALGRRDPEVDPRRASG